MNKASRTKDVEKIKFYGPLASALSFIVHFGNKKQTKLKKELKVYRGFHCSLEEITTKYKEGSYINLQGFTSTTLERSIGVDFAYNKLTAKAVEQGICPVLIEIKI